MAHHVSFEATETYLHKNAYPSDIMGDCGKKPTFERLENLPGQLIYNNTRLVIASTERQHTILNNVYNGLGHLPKAKTMASHYGRGLTIEKISIRFFWHNIKGDVEEFIKKYVQCQIPFP